MSFLKISAIAAFIAMPAAEVSAATYTYVGSWSLAVGPLDSNDPLTWTNNPPVFTGQQAAAFLFGGSASDYVISTVSNLVSDINFSAWMDGWGDQLTYATSGSPAPQDYALDSTGLGYNGCEVLGVVCFQSSYSALVNDHFDPGEFINYAFRVEDMAPVPVPAAGLLLLGAVGGLGLLARRRSV